MTPTNKKKQNKTKQKANKTHTVEIELLNASLGVHDVPETDGSGVGADGDAVDIAHEDDVVVPRPESSLGSIPRIFVPLSDLDHVFEVEILVEYAERSLLVEAKIWVEICRWKR